MSQPRIGRYEDPARDGLVIDAGDGGALELIAPEGVSVNGAPLSPGAFSGSFGFPATVDPGMIRATDVLALDANLAIYARCRDGGTITKVGMDITTSSGNISVAAYRNSGVGRAAVPGTRIGTSGAVASPGTGYREVALLAGCTLEPGDWLALSADNATVTFRSLLANKVDSNLGLGRQFRQSTAHPLPDPPASLVATTGWTIVLIGVA